MSRITALRCSAFLSIFTLVAIGAGCVGEGSPAAAGAPQSPIQADEEVVFFPTFGHQPSQDGQWRFPLHGWIFEPETGSVVRGAAIGGLRRALGVSEEESSGEVFRARARSFLVDNERGKDISILLGAGVYTLESSAANGHFQSELTLSEAEVQALCSEQSSPDKLRFRAVVRADDDRRFEGVIHLVPPDGLSVVSDIDDTVKVTGVGDKKQVLESTFLREFQAVPGMAALYAKWAAKGVRFHYVSSSPWQLYPALAKFLEGAGFPEGSFHLKLFRPKDSTFFSLFASPEASKLAVLEPLVETFPRRRFVLVGDSGEKDPEIYGALARKYPAQIERILIRNVSKEPPTSERFLAAFQGLPRKVWLVFREPTEVDARDS